MTTYNKSTLKTFFETNDVPDGNDFANFIDSYVNIVETAEQAMAGPLNTTQLVTPQISAANVNITAILSANTGYITTLTVNTFTLNGLLSVSALQATTLSVTNTVSAAALNVTGNVSAATGAVYASALRTSTGVYSVPTIISAAGTTQATGAALGLTGIVRLKGIVDGQTTGFRLLANQTGLQQTIWVEENTSCNLWPPTGGQINALSSNAAFGMAGNTQYIVTHIKASGYTVK